MMSEVYISLSCILYHLYHIWVVFSNGLDFTLDSVSADDFGNPMHLSSSSNREVDVCHFEWNVLTRGVAI